VQAVYGPVSFLRDLVAGIRHAMDADLATGGPKVTRADLLARLGSVGAPSLDNQDLVSTLVFGAGITPKPELRWLFPDAAHALVFLKPAAGVTGAAAARLAETVRRLTRASGIDGVQVTAVSPPSRSGSLISENRMSVVEIALVALLAVVLVRSLARRLPYTVSRTARADR
jgi:hypothetical protein